MRSILLVLPVVLAFSCSGSTPSPASPTPTTPTPTPVTEPPKEPAIGEHCGPGDTCASPAVCKSYFGIAGARGPKFATCEISCTPPDGPCPAGRTCKTIADGPGSVCR